MCELWTPWPDGDIHVWHNALTVVCVSKTALATANPQKTSLTHNWFSQAAAQEGGTVGSLNCVPNFPPMTSVCAATFTTQHAFTTTQLQPHDTFSPWGKQHRSHALTVGQYWSQSATPWVKNETWLHSTLGYMQDRLVMGRKRLVCVTEALNEGRWVKPAWENRFRDGDIEGH